MQTHQQLAHQSGQHKICHPRKALSPWSPEGRQTAASPFNSCDNSSPLVRRADYTCPQSSTHHASALKCLSKNRTHQVPPDLATVSPVDVAMATETAQRHESAEAAWLQATQNVTQPHGASPAMARRSPTSTATSAADHHAAQARQKASSKEAPGRSSRHRHQCNDEGSSFVNWSSCVLDTRVAGESHDESVPGGCHEKAAIGQSCRQGRSSEDGMDSETWRLSVSQGLLWNEEWEPHSTTGSSEEGHLSELPGTCSIRTGYGMMCILPRTHGAALTHERAMATASEAGQSNSSSCNSPHVGTSAQDMERGEWHGQHGQPQRVAGPCVEGMLTGSAHVKLLATAGKSRLLSDRGQEPHSEPACTPGSRRPTDGTHSSTAHFSAYHQIEQAQSFPLEPSAPDQHVCASRDSAPQTPRRPHGHARNDKKSEVAAEEDVQRLLHAAAGTILLDLARHYPAGSAGLHPRSSADGASACKPAQPCPTNKSTLESLMAAEAWKREAGGGGHVDAMASARRCHFPSRQNMAMRKELLASATFQITSLTHKLLRIQQEVLELYSACMKWVNVSRRLASQIQCVSGQGTLSSSKRNELSTSSLLCMSQRYAARPEGSVQRKSWRLLSAQAQLWQLE